MDYVTVIGLIAGALTTISFFPQVLQIHRTKQTKDLSLPMFIILTIGIFLWLIYGILSKTLPVVMSNTIAFVFCSYIVIMKIKYR